MLSTGVVLIWFRLFTLVQSLFHGLHEPFGEAIASRIPWAGSDVVHSIFFHEPSEFLTRELCAVVADHAWRDAMFAEYLSTHGNDFPAGAWLVQLPDEWELGVVVYQ